MVRDARIAWRWLDLVPAFRRLTFLVLFLFSASAFSASPPSQSSQPSQAAALAACQADLSYWQRNYAGFVASSSCVYTSDPAEGGAPSYYSYATAGASVFNEYYWWNGTFSGPSPCASLSPTTGMFGGPLAEGWSTTIPETDSSGAMVRCTVVYHAISPCVYTAKYGWQCYGTLTPTGNPATDGGGSMGGPGDWVDSGSNPPAVTPPKLPDPLPPTNTSPPQECGGGSCYDPTTGNYCAVMGGSQVCLPGDTARTPPGGCVYSSGGALCAGSPNAPGPDPTKIPNAPTDVRSTDQYNQTTTFGAQPITVTTNVFANPGTTTSSGQTSSDTGPANGGQPTTGNDGPASSSSAPSTGGTYGGGGDCNTPPICTGDAATCGAARQQWVAMCLAHGDQQQLHKDLTGDGSDPSIPPGPSKADVWTDGTSTGDSEADAANQGSYDTSGFGFDKQCPLTVLTVPLPGGKSFEFDMSKGCFVGQWLHGIIIAFALFAAAKITAGAN